MIEALSHRNLPTLPYGDRHQKYWLASFLDTRVIQGYPVLEAVNTPLTLDSPE